MEIIVAYKIMYKALRCFLFDITCPASKALNSATLSDKTKLSAGKCVSSAMARE